MIKRRNYKRQIWTKNNQKNCQIILLIYEDICQNGRYHDYLFKYFKKPEDMKWGKELSLKQCTQWSAKEDFKWCWSAKKFKVSSSLGKTNYKSVWFSGDVL